MNKEPIAIIGMGCRFPQSSHLYEFWNKLREGVDTIGQLPCDRSAKVRSNERGGFLEQADQFDAEFFGIPAKEAIARSVTFSPVSHNRLAASSINRLVRSLTLSASGVISWALHCLIWLGGIRSLKS